VATCDRDDAPIADHVRRRWLHAVHPGVTVLATTRQLTITRPLPALDEARRVAAGPAANWSELHPVVQGELTVRVCVVGAESTGKTTLVRALAKAHRTNEVGEYGRDYTIAKKDAGTNDRWTTEDFIRIAKEQQRLEDVAAVGSGPLFFCDTDAMTTALWHERYQGSPSEVVDALGRARTYDLFVLCDIDIPWERDEIRLGADTRTAMHARFVDVLTHERAEPWVLVSGSVDERMSTVAETIDQRQLLSAQSIFDPRRHHLH
jgi:HTH-type transcriptional regulator, transcriptional repressor of NAD biosynthesis genes